MMTTKQIYCILGILGMAICATFAVITFVCPVYQLANRPFSWGCHEKFLRPGVRLESVVLSTDQKPETTGNRVTAPFRVFLLDSSDQMENLVQISTASQALHFARLMTTLCGGPDGKVWEVVSYNSLHKPENYDLEDYGPGPGSRFHSGKYAVLSATAYRAGEFTPTTAESVSSGFVITRWVWAVESGQSGDRLEHWRETVASNGAYTQTALSSEPLAKLPDTKFSIDLPPD